MLNQQRELTLPRLTVAPTATSSPRIVNTPVSVAAGRVEGRFMDSVKVGMESATLDSVKGE